MKETNPMWLCTTQVVLYDYAWRLSWSADLIKAWGG